jgi:hypothetical protein
MFDTVIRVVVLDKNQRPIPGAEVTWKVKHDGITQELGPVTTQGFVDKPAELQIQGELDEPFVEITAKYMQSTKTERINIDKRDLTISLDVSTAQAEPTPAPVTQPAPVLFYALLSIVSLGICILVGWYLVNNKDVMNADTTSARGYFVLLTILGLASAAFLFGSLRSTARLTGQQFGYALDLGGPVVVAVLVVFGGFYLTKPPEEFSFYVRLRGSQPITDAIDTYVWVDFDQRRERRDFTSLGEATFPSIPSRFKNKELPIEFQSAVYKLTSPKSIYKLPDNGIIYLDVEKLPTSGKAKQGAADLCNGSPTIQ